MDLRQLQYFVNVVNLKSFTRAAEELHVAQPALGVQIRKLEDELRTKLLIRHSRGVEPTEAGLLLFERARQLLINADQTKDLLRKFTGVSRGKLILGIAPSFGTEFAEKVVQRCVELYPEVSLSVVQESTAILSEWITAGRIDLACLSRMDGSGLSGETLFHHDLYFVGTPHSLSSNCDPISFSEIAAYPLILPSGPVGLRGYIEKTAAAAGLPLQIVCEAQSDTLAFGLVQRSVGFTIQSFTAVRSEVNRGRLIARRIVEPSLPIRAYLAYSGRKSLSAAGHAGRAVVQEIVEEEMPQMDGVWHTGEPDYRRSVRDPQY